MRHSHSFFREQVVMVMFNMVMLMVNMVLMIKVVMGVIVLVLVIVIMEIMMILMVQMVMIMIRIVMVVIWFMWVMVDMIVVEIMVTIPLLLVIVFMFMIVMVVMMIMIFITMIVMVFMMIHDVFCVHLTCLIILVGSCATREWFLENSCSWNFSPARPALHATHHLGVSSRCTLLSRLHTQSRRSRFQIIIFDGFLNEGYFCIREIIPRRLYSFPCKLVSTSLINSVFMFQDHFELFSVKNPPPPLDECCCLAPKVQRTSFV